VVDESAARSRYENLFDGMSANDREPFAADGGRFSQSV
jgi:hypothetical protein